MNNLGIILAGGRSSRLFPATLSITKQLLPIYDKPLFYYPLTTLMLSGIKSFVFITNPEEVRTFGSMIRNSKLEKVIDWDVISQHKPNGIPEAFNLVRSHHPGVLTHYDGTVLILGDNIFHGATMTGMVDDALKMQGASIFVTKVPELNRFGVINTSDLTITEKPATIPDPKHTFAITGLYYFPQTVYEVARHLKPSNRGETEITDVIKHYVDEKFLNVNVMKRGVTWFDTGTADSMLDAAHYVKTVQSNAGQLVGSPHEVAYHNGWMSKQDLQSYLNEDSKSQYSRYLMELLNG